MERVTILCSDPEHPIHPWLTSWAQRAADRAAVRLVGDLKEVDEGGFLFLIACHQIVPKQVRDRFDFTLVVHASPLPRGRGWSPLVWQMLEGRNDIPVVLLNAEDGVDTGDIWRTEIVRFKGTELHDEIHERISEATFTLMDWALEHCRSAQPAPQQGEPSYYPRRSPADSRIDVEKSIAEIFDLLRVVDPVRYPAFFDFRGRRYVLRLEGADGDLQEGATR